MRLFGRIGGNRWQLRAALITPIFDLSSNPVHGPLIFAAGAIYRPGAQAVKAYRPGAKAAEIYRPGIMAGEISG